MWPVSFGRYWPACLLKQRWATCQVLARPAEPTARCGPSGPCVSARRQALVQPSNWGDCWCEPAPSPITNSSRVGSGLVLAVLDWKVEFCWGHQRGRRCCGRVLEQMPVGLLAKWLRYSRGGVADVVVDARKTFAMHKSRAVRTDRHFVGHISKSELLRAILKYYPIVNCMFMS